MGSKSVFVGLENSHLYIDMANSQVVLHELRHKIEFEEVIDQTIDNIPSELKQIETLTVADENGDPITLNVAFAISNAPIDHINLKDIKVQLPQCLWVETEGLGEDNTISIDEIDVDIVENQVIELLKIKILGSRNLDVVDVKISIKDKVSIDAFAVVPEGDIIHGVLDDIIITPKMEVPSMYIHELTGRVNIDLGKYVEPQIFDLSDLTSALNSEDLEVNLGLKAPNIVLEVANPIGISVDATLNLSASYSDGEPLALNIPIHLNGASDAGSGITRLCLTADPNSAPAGYTAVTPDGYSRLLERIPNSLAFSLEGGIDESQECHITLGIPYNFNLNIAAEIPFEFGGNTNISYKGSFEVGDTFADLGGLGIEVGEVGILLQTATTLPLEIDFSAQAVDELGQPLEDIQIVLEGGIKASADGVTPQSSQLFLGFKGNSDALGKVHAINFELTGSTGGKEGKINANQYIVANAILRAKDGITLDIKQLFDDMTLED